MSRTNVHELKDDRDNEFDIIIIIIIIIIYIVPIYNSNIPMTAIFLIYQIIVFLYI